MLGNGDRKISNTSMRKMLVTSVLQKNEPAKNIMAYTGHKSVASLMNYEIMDHKSASYINS